MKKLITALVLASSALATPAAADQATIDPNADVDSSGAIAAVELETTTSSHSLGELMKLVVDDVEYNGAGLSVLEDNRFEDETALDAYCADLSLDAVARIRVIDDGQALDIGDSGLDGPYAVWDSSRGFFDIIVELGAVGLDAPTAMSLGDKGDAFQFFDTYEKEGEKLSVKDLYEKEEWLLVGAEATAAKYDSFEGESWATFPMITDTLELRAPGADGASYHVQFFPEVEPDQSGMVYLIIISAGPMQPC